MLRYLSRYTHRVAISNHRLIAADHAGVAFRWKDYRIDGPGRWKTIGFTRTSSSGAFSCTCCPGASTAFATMNLRQRQPRRDPALLGADLPAADPQQQSDILPIAPRVLPCPCPRCGDRMIVIEVFARGCKPRWRPTPTTSGTS